MSQLVLLDWVIVLFYFAAVFGIAFWVIRQKQKSTADYFLTGKNVGWFVVGASLFASNIGSEHLVGLAGAGAESGVVFGHLEFQASIVLLLLGWVFVPFYARSGVFTMPEFLERRYSQAARWYLSIISVVGYVLTKICVTIYAGGVVFETLMGIDFWTGAIAIVILTGIYTVIGGPPGRYLYRGHADGGLDCGCDRGHRHRAREDWRMERALRGCRKRLFQRVEAGLAPELSMDGNDFSARPSSRFGIGVRISTSFRGPSPQETKARPGGGRSSQAS